MTDSNNAVPRHHRRQFFRTKLNSDDVWNETWSNSLETIPLQITFAKYVALEISNWFFIVPVQLHQYDGFNISTFDSVPMLRGFLKTLFPLCMSIYYILLSTTSCKKNQDLHKSTPFFSRNSLCYPKRQSCEDIQCIIRSICTQIKLTFMQNILNVICARNITTY